MSKQPSPQLRELASELFAAGRAEGPSSGLERQVKRLAAQEPCSTAGLGDSSEPSRPPRSDTGGRRLGGALWLGGLALAAGAALWLTVGRPPPTIALSAEPGPLRALPVLGSAHPVEVDPSLPAKAPSAPLLTPLRSPSERPLAERGAPMPREGAPSTLRSASEIESASEVTSVATDADAGKHPPVRNARLRNGKKGQARLSVEPLRPIGSRSRSAGPTQAAAPKPGSLVRSPTSPVGSAMAPSALTLSAELQLLRRARLALRSGEAAQAVEWLDQHAEGTQGDRLQAEALLLRMEALSALGDSKQASSLAESFVQDSPHHALADRARSFLNRP